MAHPVQVFIKTYLHYSGVIMVRR